MIEISRPPGIRRVAGGTLSSIVIIRLVGGVTSLALRRPGYCMVEGGLRPIEGVMATRALTLEVVFGFILNMARLAVPRSSQRVIEMDFIPISAGVTGGAIASEVWDWFHTGMTGLACRGRACIPACGVAALTGQFGVLTGKREKSMQCSGAARWE